MLQLILWAIPVLLLVVCLIALVTVGGKRGWKYALISCGAMLLSAVLAFLGAQGMAKLGAGALSDLFGTFMGSVTEIPETVTSLLDGILRPVSAALAAPAFFSGLLLFLFFLTKLIAAAVYDGIGRKNMTDENADEKAAGRLPGALIGAGEAVLLALLLLLPLYGTAGVTARLADAVLSSPAAASLFAEEGGLTSAEDTVKAVCNNGAVRLYGTGPLGGIYEGLTSLRYQGRVTSLGRMADGAAELIRTLPALPASDPNGEKKTDLKEWAPFVSGLRTFSSENPMGAGLIFDVIPVFLSPEVLGSEGGAPAENGWESALNDFAASVRENGTQVENLDALLAVAEAYLNADSDDGLPLTDPGFIDAVVRETNATEEIARLKKDLITAVFHEAELPISEEAVRSLTEDMERLEGEDVEKEGRALLKIFTAAKRFLGGAEGGAESPETIAELLEGMAIHPAIGPGKTVGILKELLVANAEEIAEGAADVLLNTVQDALEKTAEQSGEDGEGGLSSLFSTAMLTTSMLDDIISGSGNTDALRDLIASDPAAIRQLSGCVTTELLTGYGVPADKAESVRKVICTLFEEMAAAHLTGADAAAEAKAIGGVLDGALCVIGVNDSGDIGMMPQADRFIENAADSALMMRTVERLTVGENGVLVNDPTGWFAELDAASKSDLEGNIRSYTETHPSSERTAALLTAFLGLN